jgi:mannose-6-phosphate isomerase-like protein (cupin superfamily)
MVNVSIVGPAEGEVAVSGPVQMRILEDGSATSHRLGLGEITIAPHTDGPPQHRHAQHDEGFYVVSGTAQFTVGPATYVAGSGQPLSADTISVVMERYGTVPATTFADSDG